ncbi:glycine--tRNA ligase [Erysipelothrix rhusiopathiae]|uniref:glycine--tRNA ligase n=1 Tax=Erysipelothrix rhusiopathiae TaxID=1648 RepID=UPI002B2554F3|nr:glycine--tRNA ligase [Erysipelothrix rhusiopathiae]WRB92293.1 glycine--tRNA ligase [Erysipelothrix rhusiopathiae]
MKKYEFETIVNHVRTSGFVFQGSEIYGGLANTWDFGPLGIELKQNVKKLWWESFVSRNPYNVGIQSAILMNPSVWQASGHLDTFNDPLMDCRKCNTRHRADKLIEEFSETEINAGVMSNEDMELYIQEHQIPCPNCGGHDFTNIRQFNLMFKTFQGVTEDISNAIYLRPETAQGMFVNYRNVQRSMRKKLPFGIAQIGKSFRNEITPGQFIFRTREFEQMELEFFVKPGEDLEWYEYWKKFAMDWLIGLGIKPENLRLREHDEDELSHYSKGTSDIEYRFPWGFDELWGIADRTDYDLKQHQEHSKVSMEYLDPETNEKYIPYCVEPSLGVERLMLALICEVYDEEELENDTRVVMHFSPKLAPTQVCVLPLSKKLSEPAREVMHKLMGSFACDFDETASIGKRYRRQDAIGTPFCITFDFDSLEDEKVTLRYRDSMEQVRVSVDEAIALMNAEINK